MSRIPLPYNQKVLDLFRNPKNLGKMDDATVSAIAGSPACGDMVAFYLKIKNGTVEKASFESYGCAANIAVASMATEMIIGKKIEDVWKVSWKQISDSLGTLPTVKFHCGILAIGALRRAIRKYYKTKNIKPEWLPEASTFEEKQALEEEDLVDFLSKKVKGQRLNADQ